MRMRRKESGCKVGADRAVEIVEELARMEMEIHNSSGFVMKCIQTNATRRLKITGFENYGLALGKIASRIFRAG